REVYVREGQKVREGETIGTSGRADALSPPMLHFEILDATEVLDPLKWLKPR
ncbi:MAG TPA: M23 family metallopeptidase, partial [Candidatus Latescibacteria bacterium]|nr:M23 family metallopeptidase [Candidatus Latescibacterota bacterium]